MNIIDNIMENNVINSTESHDIDVPDGGFPPIYIRNEKHKEESKNRQMKRRKGSLSIKDILKNKKDESHKLTN